MAIGGGGLDGAVDFLAVFFPFGTLKASAALVFASAAASLASRCLISLEILSCDDRTLFGGGAEPAPGDLMTSTTSTSSSSSETSDICPRDGSGAVGAVAVSDRLERTTEDSGGGGGLEAECWRWRILSALRGLALLHASQSSSIQLSGLLL